MVKQKQNLEYLIN